MNKLIIPLLVVLCFCVQGSYAAYNITLPGNGTLIASTLQNLTIPVSNFTMRVPALGANVNATNTLCFNLTAISIFVELCMENYTNPDFPTLPLNILYINATLYNVTADCTGNFTYKVPPILTGEGTLNMTLDNQSSISLLIGITQVLNSTAPANETAPPPAALTNFGMNEFITMVSSIKSGDYDAFFRQSNPEQNQLQLKSVEATTNGATQPPVYFASNSSCDVVVSVGFFNTTDPLINSTPGPVIQAIEDTVPGVLCADLGMFIQNNVSGIINVVSYSLFSFVNGTRYYEYPEAYNDEAKYFFISFSVLWVVMVTFYVAFLVYQYYNRKNLRNNDEAIGILQGEMDMKQIYNKRCSLIEHSEIHWFYRYGILLAMLWNIALFASATISIAASVYIYIQITDTILPISPQAIQSQSLYSFTLISSVREMWNAGVWPLSLLIAVSSGFWPYIKLIFMFFCWITPSRFLPPKWRGRLLFVLDVLGKWSLIDAYVLVLFVNAFRVPLQFMIPYFGTFKIDMVVQVEYAYYSYLVATMCSLALTHIILYFHHHVSEPPLPKRTPTEALNKHNFKLNSKNMHLVFSFTILGKVTIIALLVVAIAAAIVACSIKSFAITYEGSLIGTLLELTGGNPNPTFSIFELTKALPDTTYYDPSNIGIRLIQITFAMFAYAIPLAFLVSLILLWLTPLNSVGQYLAFIAVEVLNAWSAVDVFIVAIIVALLELEQFAKFIIAGKCNAIDQLITILNPAVENPTCFNVRATLSSGTWLLLASVIVLVIIGYFVMYLCNKAITERLTKARDSEARLINTKNPDDSDGEDVLDVIKSNLQSIASFSGALSTSVGGCMGVLRKLSCIRVFRVHED